MFTNSYIGVKDATNTIIDLTKKTAESQFQIGEVLKGLKSEIQSFKKGDWNAKGSDYKLANFEYDQMVENDLPFGKVVANKLVQIASDKMIKKHLFEIPFAYNTMYELIGMIPKQWKFYFKKGLTGKSTANDIKTMKKAWLDKNLPKVTDESNENDNSSPEVISGTENKILKPPFQKHKKVKVLFSKQVLEVNVTEINITWEQTQKLQNSINDLVQKFFKSEKITGEVKVISNSDIGTPYLKDVELDAA